MPLRLGGSAEEGWASPLHARLCADLVAAKRSAPFAVWTYTQSAGSITIHDYYGQNGVGLDYAPLANGAVTGIALFGWNERSFEDPYGVRESFKARACTVTAHGSTPIIANGYLLFNFSTIQVHVSTFDAGGTAADCKATVAVW